MLHDKLKFPPRAPDAFPVIAISGLHGSGKSTYAKTLANKFRLEYVSGGKIFRRYAEEHGLTLSELSAQIHTLPSIDYQIDQQAIDAAIKGRVIIDASISGWILQDYSDLSILITAPFDQRVARIAARDKVPLGTAHEETKQREDSETQRYQKLYGIDVNDWSPFDLILNTARLTIDEAESLLLHAITAFLKLTPG